MAYYLYRYKGWAPNDYYGRPAGERLILRAFVEKEIDARAEHPDMGCPLLRMRR